MEYIKDFLVTVMAGIAVECIRVWLDQKRKGR